MALIERTLSLPQWWVEAQLTELFTPVTDVVPVVGAGVGAGVGLPDAGALAEWLAEKLPLVEQPENPRDLFRVVDLVDPDQASRADLARLVAERITSVSAQPPRFLEELVRLPSRLILTFNYDDLIGDDRREAGDRRLPLERAGTGRGAGGASPRHGKQAGWPPRQLTVLHLHGRASRPETMVLDDRSYEEVMRSPEVKELLGALVQFRKFAFVGTTLDETYVRSLLQERINTPYHVLLCHEKTRPALVSGRGALSERRQHLKVVGYSSHDDLVLVPRWLTAPQPPHDAPEPAPPLDEPAAPDPALYVFSDLAERIAGAEGSSVRSATSVTVSAPSSWAAQEAARRICWAG